MCQIGAGEGGQGQNCDAAKRAERGGGEIKKISRAG
jgi:hypothetical protein